MTGAVILPAPPCIEIPRIRVPRWTRPWERTKEDLISEANSLVGAVGAETTLNGTAQSIPFGTGATPVAGDLIVCFIMQAANANDPTVAGYTAIGTRTAQTIAPFIFYKVAVGSDSAPVTGTVAGQFGYARTYVFRGTALASPLDKSGTGGNATATATATESGADASTGSLVLVCAVANWSAAQSGATTTAALTVSGTSQALTAVTNGGALNASQYTFGYFLNTAANSSANAATVTASIATSITGVGITIASFKPNVPAGGMVRGRLRGMVPRLAPSMAGYR